MQTRQAGSVLSETLGTCSTGAMPAAAAVRGDARWRLIAAAVAALLFAAPALAADAVHLASLRPSLPGPAAADRASDLQVSPYARRLAELINDYRANRGLGPLELVPELSALASEHSTQMAEHRRLSHDGFRSRFDRTRARVCVENVGVNFPHEESQLDGWRASPGHHRNLLEPKVVRVGIAKSASFVTFFACS
jgi:uncharacterized protein YkwD